jgi:hypothetical protein
MVVTAHIDTAKYLILSSDFIIVAIRTAPGITISNSRLRKEAVMKIDDSLLPIRDKAFILCAKDIQQYLIQRETR